MKMLKVSVCLALLMTSAVASAGWKYTNPVMVYEGGAKGVVGDARASSDSYQYIACWASRSANFNYAYCSARNAALVTTACSTQDPQMVAAAQAAVSGYIEFAVGAGGCTFIGVETSSRYRPLTP